jgi:hypothetical protein
VAVELGIVEGYYGRPWTWADRQETIEFLAPHGYGFFLYAPKADAYLRRRWREEHPPEMADQLRALAARCRDLGVRFGVGLSPFEVYRDFDGAAREALGRKLAWLDDLAIDDLAILFDDMRGDMADLAATQAAILHWIAGRTKARRLIVCPTYYSDDPRLDRAFGRRPANYLAEFGAALDPSIEVFWTGEEVCSREFSLGGLDRVAQALGRKPFLWDNYPVNDGPRMSPFLHLRAFTGRPAAIGPHIRAHAINPALQPTLSRVPALTLADSYRLGDAYQYGEAFARAATRALGDELGGQVRRHLSSFQELGRDRLGESAGRLRDLYSAIDHPGAREIVAWLDGGFVVTREMMEGA